MRRNFSQDKFHSDSQLDEDTECKLEEDQSTIIDDDINLIKEHAVSTPHSDGKSKPQSWMNLLCFDELTRAGGLT